MLSDLPFFRTTKPPQPPFLKFIMLMTILLKTGVQCKSAKTEMLQLSKYMAGHLEECHDKAQSNLNNARLTDLVTPGKLLRQCFLPKRS